MTCIRCEQEALLVPGRNICRLCKNEEMRLYRLRPEAKATRASYLATYERPRDPKAEFLGLIKRRYGMSELDFDTMLLAQNGLCAACGVQLIKFHIDHDHKTLKVRGLLCHGCNIGVGYVEHGLHYLWEAYLHSLQ